MKRVPVTVWMGCYEKQWTGVLIPDAFKHPAKFSRGLVERLLDYGVEKGYWSKGDRLGDPFGGIGGGAIPAADRGLEWIGCELEQQFVEIGNRNLEAHGHKWRTMGLPTPTLVQGDSRDFATVVRSAAGIVTSPPFLDARSGTTRSTSTKKGGDCAARHHTTQAGAGYGESDEQIGNLPPGELDGAVTSPPYAGTAVAKHSTSIDIEKNFETYRSSGGGMSFEAYRDYQASLSIEYGNNEAQIGNLRETQLDAAVTSPPFGTREDGGGIAQTGDTSRSRGGKRISRGAIAAVVTSPPYSTIAAGAGGLNHLPPKQEGQQSGRAHAGSQDTDQRYGDDAGQIAKLGAGNVEAVITSPPHGNTMRGQKDGIDWEKARRKGSGGGEHQKQGASCHATYGDNDPANIGKLGGVVTSPPYDTGLGHGGSKKKPVGRGDKAYQDRMYARYGDNPAQIERLSGVVTSPPFERSTQVNNSPGDMTAGKAKWAGGTDAAARVKQDYHEPTSEGQIGRAAGETYWQAMSKVYASCFEAIKPGGYLACVVKDYVREFKIVPLCDDTMRLLEHVGFEPIERIHAMVTEQTRHADLFEGETVTKKSRKSFFRRLQEKRGAPPIDFEEILIVRKPL